MINTNKVKLFEEFAAGEISNPDQNVAPAGNMDASTVTVDKTAMSGEQVRAEIIKDVDAILTNLETLSKQITESIDKDFFFEKPGLVNEKLDSIIDWVKKEANFVKGMALLQGKYKQLLQTADSNIIAAQEYDAIKKIDAAIDKMKRARDEASGPKKDAIQQKAIQTIAKLKEKKAGIDSKFEETKEAAKEALAEVEEKMKKYEGNMPSGTQGELYDSTKRKTVSEIKMEGLKAKTKMLKEKGNADAAKEAADELKKIGIRSKEAEAGIKELSKDVDPKLEEQIKKIQTEIDREKDEDLAAIQSTITDLKKSLSDDDAVKNDAAKKKEVEDALEKEKAKEDKTLEGIYYLEDYLEELKAQRAALKGEEYDKAESKVGSTEDGESGEREENPLMKDDGKGEEKPESDVIKKAEDKLASAEKALKDDQEELAQKPEDIKKMEDELKDLRKEIGQVGLSSKEKQRLQKAKELVKSAQDAVDNQDPDEEKHKANVDKLARAKKAVKDILDTSVLGENSITEETLEFFLELEENKSSDIEARKQVLKDELEALKQKLADEREREQDLKQEEIPQDKKNVDKAVKDLEAAKKGEFDDIKKKQKEKLKSTKESKELTWDSLKEDLGLNQKVEKVHESFSIADKMRLILKR